MSFSAVLLCGGESSRMGRDKADVEWNGQALWQLQLGKLRALRPEKILISARTDKHWRPADATLILDELEMRGPMSGVAAALRVCESEHLLVLAIDLPLITSQYLDSMLCRASRGTGIVPTIGGRFEPVAAVYARESAGAFETGATSLQTVIYDLVCRGEMRALDVQPHERAFFRNVNQPADLLAS